jgi:hypothetical protein
MRFEKGANPLFKFEIARQPASCLRSCLVYTVHNSALCFVLLESRKPQMPAIRPKASADELLKASAAKGSFIPLDDDSKATNMYDACLLRSMARLMD